jgi:hypothetical protein
MTRPLLNAADRAAPAARADLSASVTVQIKQRLYCGGGWKRLRAELLRMGDGEYEVTVTRVGLKR